MSWGRTLYILILVSDLTFELYHSFWFLHWPFSIPLTFDLRKFSRIIKNILTQDDYLSWFDSLCGCIDLDLINWLLNRSSLSSMHLNAFDLNDYLKINQLNQFRNKQTSFKRFIHILKNNNFRFLIIWINTHCLIWGYLKAKVL